MDDRNTGLTPGSMGPSATPLFSVSVLEEIKANLKNGLDNNDPKKVLMCVKAAMQSKLLNEVLKTYCPNSKVEKLSDPQSITDFLISAHKESKKVEIVEKRIVGQSRSVQPKPIGASHKITETPTSDQSKTKIGRLFKSPQKTAVNTSPQENSTPREMQLIEKRTPNTPAKESEKSQAFNYDLAEATILHASKFVSSMNKRGLVETSLNDLSEIIFNNQSVDVEKIIDMVIKDTHGALLLSQIISKDDGKYSDRKMEFINIIKKKMNSGEHKDQLSNLKKDLDRMESYLQQNKNGEFLRKKPKLGVLSGISEKLLDDGKLFFDKEIISKSRSKDVFLLGQGAGLMTISDNNKVVIQQAAAKSCGGTCVCMLLLDQGYSPPLNHIRGHLTQQKDRVRLLEQAGATVVNDVIKTKSGTEFLNKLKNRIDENGPAIIRIGGNDEGSIGGHVLICDHISDELDSVRIRDPFHGWEITIAADALLKRVVEQSGSLFSTELEQIKKN